MHRVPRDGWDNIVHGVREQSLSSVRSKGVLGERRLVLVFPSPPLPQVRSSTSESSGIRRVDLSTIRSVRDTGVFLGLLCCHSQ